MRNYLLLMRGDQSYFTSMVKSEQMKIIMAHQSFAHSLEELGCLVDGDGLSDKTLLYTNKNGNLKSMLNPFANTANQLSGYYIIKCDSFDEATEIAQKCPALIHGETVEVVPIGHE